MSTTDPVELTAVAVRVAEKAAEHVRTRRPEVFGSEVVEGSVPQAVSTKSTDTDPVTVVDTESETLLRDLLAELRPGDAVLGEEEGGSIAVPAGVRWVVDPIDGTVNFLYGIPAYSVSVGAQVEGRTVAGAVVDVARGITYSATRGGGAFSDDGRGPVRLACNVIDDVGLALVATGFGYASSRRSVQGSMIASLLPHIRDVRRIGSAALDLCMVASGAVDAHYEHGLSPWDWAAGSLIAEEAGAVVRIPAATSRSTQGDVTLAMAPGIASELTALLTGLGALDPIPV
ncbi:inositol monophosphatase family protein [Gordonia rubripertincta]|uniref:Inositol-1-monophosphatase n=1 Tax=Gordonia rubripertincta TaxID=36822 RepID=A0ABT4MWR8_GORRU|nr:inositol monophosphatase family protein [Gordonia rubripertincta]MCZ4550481.1 inositol monophosphatase family protein [Gordonia rubripertincta]